MKAKLELSKLIPAVLSEQPDLNEAALVVVCSQYQHAKQSSSYTAIIRSEATALVSAGILVAAADGWKLASKAKARKRRRKPATSVAPQ